MITAFLFFGAAANFATGNPMCGALCFVSAVARVMLSR